MLINQKKTVQVDVKTMEIHCKVSDRFGYQLKDAQGDLVFEQEDGYVPGFMPGEHYGDYVILTIDIETARITNWVVPSAQELTDVIQGADDE